MGFSEGISKAPKAASWKTVFYGVMREVSFKEELFEAEKAVAIWIFVKELSSKVRCSMGDNMIAVHCLKIYLKSGDAERRSVLVVSVT